MGIEIYHTLGSSPCRIVTLLAKHLDLNVETKSVDLGSGEHMKPEFLKINPQHTVPTLVDDGFMINESRAAIQYLANKYSKDDSLYPKDPQKRAVVDMRLFFDIGTLYLRFSEAYYPVMFMKQKQDSAKLERLDDALGFAETFLKDGFAAGSELTIADFSFATTLSTIAACDHDLSKCPNIKAYLEKCKGLMKGWDEVNQAGADMFGAWYKSVYAEVHA